jgi:uncharacterized phage-associated protein
MAHAIEVARYLVQLAFNEEEPDFLTHLRLQKLLYYIQAWSLVNRGQVMFPERIEAWAHGPVVPDVFKVFSDHGRRPILPDDIGELEFDLTDEEKDFIASVWEAYKGYSALKLREMTRQEDPWRKGRVGHGPTDSSNDEITPEAMLEYFGTVPAE